MYFTNYNRFWYTSVLEILILHGWGQDKSLWEVNVKQLKHIAKTKAIDLPGFGKEPLVSTHWGIPEYAHWVGNYIKENKLKEVVLIGHSFGGRIAGYLASQNPSWLKYLIVEGSPLLYRPTKQTIWRIKLYKAMKRFLPASIRHLFYAGELQDAHNRNLGTIFRNVVNFDQTKIIKKIKVPTLIIWGGNDTTVPLYVAQEIHSLIPKSELTVIRNAGHTAHLDNPNLFYGSVRHFIQTH
jgi:pimeloyl-ACP methyl ester carboxylesterase